MFRRLGPAENTLSDISRVEGLVRARFDVGGDEIILVSQDPGTKPGFPAQETNIVFFKDQVRYRLKIFSPVARVAEKDLPLKWLLPALEDNGENECC